MKKILIGFTIASTLIALSCKKNNNNSSANLPLLQHKWMVVSINGEALRYVGAAGDYYNFATDNFLYQSVNNVLDTSGYNLLSDGRTLLLYPVVDGVKSSTATTYNLNTLSSNQLILSSHSGVVFSLDSLKR